MIVVYFWLLRVAALFNHKAKLLVKGEKQALKQIEAKLQPNAHYTWFHAASVGEFEQARPLIEKIKKEHPEKKIILTFFSPSGYEMRKNYPLADIVAYLPFATRRKSRKFVDLVKPDKAIFIKYEFWPNYLKALKKKGIPTYVVAAIFNKKQAFFKWYGVGYRKCLKLFTRLYVQDDASARLLAKYKITNTVVSGDPRFDRVSALAATAPNIPIIEQFIQEQPVLIAGSTWGPDEELLISYYEKRHNFKLILVPHEIHAEHLHKIFMRMQGRFVRYTEATPQNINMYDCMVVDTMGLLSSIYRYATVAYIGGGFGAGIHNTIEAAVYGLPVVFGPKYDKFREAHGLIACKAGFTIRNYQQMERVLDTLMATPSASGEAADAYVQSETGAVDKIDIL